MSKQILIVEDDPFLREWVSYELETEGYIVSLAADGFSGLAQAQAQNRPDLILLDVQLPGMDGFTLCRTLQTNPYTSNIPVVFLTARAAMEDKLTGFNTGGIDYLTKPFKMTELKARIKNFLAHDALSRQQGARDMAATIKQAADLQKSLIPTKIPAICGLDLCARYRPASHISGDFYDFFVRPDGQLVFTAADISGKGLPAAMTMSAVRTALRGPARLLSGPAAVLSQANDNLYDDLTEINKFSTVFMGFYNPATRQVTYANAGHSPVIYYPAGEQARILESDGPPLGVLPTMLSQNHQLTLNPNDVLMICSDGFNEAENQDGAFFGREQLLSAVTHLAHKPAGQIVSALFEQINAFAAGRAQLDDQTLIVLKGEPYE